MLADLRIVLLRPQGAANLGAVARALKNFGLHRLLLVDERVTEWTEAWRMAVKAGDVLEGAQRCATLAEALAPATWVVATSDRPLPGLRVLTPRQVAEEARERGAPTLLFGGEQHGLFQGELLRCHATASIPVAPAQSSLNLAQAVCVFAAEWFVVHGGGAKAPPRPAPLPASHDLLQRLEVAVAGMLAGTSWHDATRPKNALGELMQPFYRAGLTDDEVRLWLVALGKAAQAPRH